MLSTYQKKEEQIKILYSVINVIIYTIKGSFSFVFFYISDRVSFGSNFRISEMYVIEEVKRLCELTTKFCYKLS